MKKQIFKKIRLLALSMVAFVSCTPKGFYEYSSDRDVIRIPMIKPYEMLSYNGGVSWFFKLPDTKYNASQEIQHIKSIGIKDSLIVFFTDELNLPKFDDSYTNGWFIVDTETKTEVVYTSEVSYKAALDSLKVGNVKLYDINKVFNDFNETNKWPLEWPKEAHE